MHHTRTRTRTRMRTSKENLIKGDGGGREARKMTQQLGEPAALAKKKKKPTKVGFLASTWSLIVTRNFSFRRSHTLC
jgi:hypothetical protein